MKAGIKNKVLLCFIFLVGLVVAAFIYSAVTFRELERRMQAVNDVHVPAIRAINQIESSLFLLESDLDKSLSEGILRPKDALEGVITSRLDLLERLNREDPSRAPALDRGLNEVRLSYNSFGVVAEKLYRNWLSRSELEEELSKKRSDLRFKIKALIRDVEKEQRDVSTRVQQELQSLGFMLSILVVFSAAIAFALYSYLARALRPLETLAYCVRTIAHEGLSAATVRELAAIPDGHDEIGTLSRETYKMAASILDAHKILQDQKVNLERAHRDMARQNEELRSTQNKLAHSEKLSLVGRMAAQMAHEIRNPLNALNLHFEILEDQLRGDADALEGVKPLRAEINKLISVTESYLDLARGPRLQKNPADINSIVEELQELYLPLMKEKGISFTCDLGDIPPVLADRPQIAQVFGNLIKNSTEAFTEQHKAGRRFIRLMTSFLAHEKMVVITVMDNGAGISREAQKNIFSPFYTNKAEGTGLGLTFSRQVIDAHGGEISFDSTADQGTMFIIRLPLHETLKEEILNSGGRDKWTFIAPQS